MPGQQEAHRNSLNFCSGTCRLRGNDDRAPTRPRLWRPSTRSRRNFCEAAAMRQQVDSPDTSQERVSCLTHTRLAEIVEVRILIPLFSVLRLCFMQTACAPSISVQPFLGDYSSSQTLSWRPLVVRRLQKSLSESLALTGLPQVHLTLLDASCLNV